jgi:hypothetical protein
MFRKVTIAVVAAGALAAPAASQADTVTFGIRLDHEPSNSLPAHTCEQDGAAMFATTCTRMAISEGRAVRGSLVAPADGTIVKLRIRAGGPDSVRFRLGHRNARDEWKSAGFGPVVQLEGRGYDERTPIETFRTKWKVHKGDYLGIDSEATSALYCAGGGNAMAIFSRTLDGMGQMAADTDGCELLVQAVMRVKKH